MLAWDLLFHSPGDRFYCSFIRIRLEITSFQSPEAPGGAQDVGFIVHGSRWSWLGQVLTVIHGLGLRQFLFLFSIEFITCFPNDILWP